jgi:glutathione S-transferase
LQFINDNPPGGFKSIEHYKLNNRGQIPILKDGDTIINESLAQMLYIENFYPGEITLMPKSKEEYGPALVSY